MKWSSIKKLTEDFHPVSDGYVVTCQACAATRVLQVLYTGAKNIIRNIKLILIKKNAPNMSLLSFVFSSYIIFTNIEYTRSWLVISNNYSVRMHMCSVHPTYIQYKPIVYCTTISYSNNLLNISTVIIYFHNINIKVSIKLGECTCPRALSLMAPHLANLAATLSSMKTDTLLLIPSALDWRCWQAKGW